MAVQEQTPYQEITANGVTTSFVLDFDCENKDHLIVTLDGIEPPVGNWSLTGGSVVFTTAPANGVLVAMQRNTPFSRTTDYQSYNNSFRPPAVNKDFDWIWFKLQELGVADWILGNRIDALKNYVDDRDDELRAYLLEEIRKQGVALDQLEDYYNYLMQRLAEIAVNGGWESSFVSYGSINQKKYNDGVESITELLAIQNPFQGMRVYVKSYYAGLNTGGGEFVFKAGAAETEVAGFVVNVAGGVWKRVLKNVHSIDDAGAHPTKTAIENANAINAILGFVKVVQVPTADYSVEPSIIKINSGNVLFGNSRLIGTAPNTLGIADGTGEYLLLDGVDGAIIKDVQLINGYKSVAIMSLGSKNLYIDNVTIDGFSYGMWIAEQDFSVANSQGSQNILINNPKILNTRYWGIYARSYNITDEAKKTQNIKCINPYFYNCNMAAFVCAEGNVKYVTLENPVFNRCNVCMHFEFTSDYTVNNARDYDTGKKSDHVPSNTEYPFVDWSIYHCFSRNSKINNCTFEKTAYHLANEGASKVKAIHYSNTTALTYVFEGVGPADVDKDYFSDVTWDQCTSISEFIYQQPNDTPSTYLRDFKVSDSRCLLDGAGNGAAVGISIVRGVNFTLDNTTFTNSCLRLKLSGLATITNNKWLKGTDNTQSIIEGTGGSLGDANFLIATDNIFARAGGGVFGDSAIHFKNWTSVRADNVVRVNSIAYAYRFTDCFRVDFGAGLIYDNTVGEFAESGTSSLVYLYR